VLQTLITGCWRWLHSVQAQITAAGLAGGMAYLRARYNGDPQSCVDAVICSIFGWFADDILTLLGANSDLAYMFSVFLGFMGTKYLSGKIREYASRKTMK
jgi:lambda family phage holin